MGVRFTRLLLCAALLCGADVSVRAAHTQARLVLTAESVRPGDTVLAGVQLRMDPHWHTYWRNSGASGLPTSIVWHLPSGVTAGEIQWPVPEKLPDADLTTYIYQDEAVLLVPLKFAPDLAPGPLTLKADLSWLECEVQCVKGSASVEAMVNVGTETKPSKDARLLATWQKKLPGSGKDLAARAWWEQPASGSQRPLILEWNSAGATDEADFFPDASEQFEVQGPTERVPAEPGKIRLRKQVRKLEGDWPTEISGLVAQGSGAERVGYEVKVRTGAAPAAALSATPTHKFWLNLLGAFLGGLILNLMPCVLPVISLKILGFVSQARENPRQVRKFGLIYTFGVLVSFLILAGIVVGLKAAGKNVGWGFQFTNPYFLLFMTVLVALVALNLFGVFEVTPGGRTLTAASTLSSKHGAAGTFFNGLLATVLATSCSAPILAGAVGYTFAQSAHLIVLMMLTVGLGLALPYLLLSWNPAWLRFLPRPGPWMEKFKVAMGFPMLAAGVWLCSLLTIHFGERAWWMAVFLVFLALSAWIYGEFVQRGRKHRTVAAAVSVLLLGLGYGYALEKELRWRDPVTAAAPGNTPKESPSGIAWQEWSPEAVAAARAQGRPVLVDFTAKWCPTCNTVFKSALESVSVRNKIREINAVPLLANYTLQPAAMTAELNRFGRAGVPLVVIYPRDLAAAPLVFDWVTPGILVEALNRAPR